MYPQDQASYECTTFAQILTTGTVQTGIDQFSSKPSKNIQFEEDIHILLQYFEISARNPEAATGGVL